MTSEAMDPETRADFDYFTIKTLPQEAPVRTGYGAWDRRVAFCPEMRKAVIGRKIGK